MIRRLGFAVFAAMLMFSACGRQVTPDRAGTNASGLPAGFMSVTFNVVGTPDFSKYQYAVVFNTTGNGITPLANATQTNYVGYSFAIVLAGVGGQVSTTVYEFFRAPGTPATQIPSLLPLPGLAPQLLTTTPTANGFTVVFNRAVFNGFPATNGATPPPIGTTWLVNYFTLQTTPTQLTTLPTIVDSLGAGGATDTTYQSPQFTITTAFSQQITPMVGTHPLDPNAVIGLGQIQNSP